MNEQGKITPINEDGINLYDYWKVVVKRKKLIIALFLVSVICTATISLLMPKIYCGEAILSLKIMPANEMAYILGKNLQKENIFPKTYNLINSIKISPIRDSSNKLQVSIESKKVDGILNTLSELIEYINSRLMKRDIDQAREVLKVQSEQLSVTIKSSEELMRSYIKLFSVGKVVPMGFNPIDIGRSISNTRVEKLKVDQAYNNLVGVEVVDQPYISKIPVKPRIKENIVIAGVISLFIGIFLAFFMEYLEKIRKDSSQE